MWIWNPPLPVIQSQCDVHGQIRQNGAVLCKAVLKLFADALGYPSWDRHCVYMLRTYFVRCVRLGRSGQHDAAPLCALHMLRSRSTVLHKFTPLIGVPEMATHIELRMCRGSRVPCPPGQRQPRVGCNARPHSGLHPRVHGGLLCGSRPSNRRRHASAVGAVTCLATVETIGMHSDGSVVVMHARSLVNGFLGHSVHYHSNFLQLAGGLGDHDGNVIKRQCRPGL